MTFPEIPHGGGEDPAPIVPPPLPADSPGPEDVLGLRTAAAPMRTRHAWRRSIAALAITGVLIIGLAVLDAMSMTLIAGRGSR